MIKIQKAAKLDEVEEILKPRYITDASRQRLLFDVQCYSIQV